jgi:anthranilate synthase component 1
LLVFDHLTRTAALLHDGSEAERQALRRDVVQALRGGVPAMLPRGRFSPANPSLTEQAHAARVRRAQEYIAAGDVYQLVLASRFEGHQQLAPFEVYRALRLLNPSPYMYFCELGDITVVGSSPEALVKCHDGYVQLRPIAGSRPRGADAARDAALEAELLADPKENAEHVMLVDLARNDLGRVATAGSVAVNPYRVIERYSHVMHIVSGVNGRLRPGQDAFDLFAATFPAGTLVGAPRCAPWKSSTNSNRWAGSSTAGRSATSAGVATWIKRSPSARWSFEATRTVTKPGAVSSPTVPRKPNTPS